MLVVLLLLFVTPIEQETADALTLWKYCVTEKAKLYEPTRESIAKVADLAIIACEDFEKEFLNRTFAQFSSIPNAKSLWAVQEAAKSRDRFKERIGRDAEIVVANIRVGLSPAAEK